MGIEEIVSQVKTRLGQTSLSDRTLTDYFTAINPTAEPDDAFWAAHTKILTSLAGQYNHDVAEWQKKYEEKRKTTPNPNPNPNPPTPPTEPNNLDPNVKAMLDKMAKQDETIAKLSQLVLGQQKKATEEEIRSAAQRYGESLKCEKPELWKSAMKFTSVGEGMTEEQFKQAVKTNYESLIAATGSGAKPYNNGQGGPNEDNSKAIEDYFKSKFGSEAK